MHWTANQMNGRQCTIVLIGVATAHRPWTFYEIAKSWNDGMGVVGLNIHGIKDASGNFSQKGANPLDHLILEPSGAPLSSVVKTYDPTNRDEHTALDWIAVNLKLAVSEAIRIRQKQKNLRAVYGK